MRFERKVGRGHGEIREVGLVEAKALLADNWLPLRADGSYAVLTQPAPGRPKMVDGKTLEEHFGLPAPVYPAAILVNRHRPWAALAVLVGVYLLGRRG